MRVFLFICAMLFSVLFSENTYATHYPSARIARYVAKTPRKAEESINSLVHFLVKPLDDDYDRAKAIAFWIASHINYDEYLYHDGRTTKLINSYRGQEPREVLKSRVGICGDFADLFVEMCKKAGIRAYEVHGYSYPGNKPLSHNKLRKLNTGHVWNYFVYGGQKIYVDTTFMAKGATGVSGYGGNFAHRKALKEIKQDNRYKSQINEFDEYYFDFDYKDEQKERRYVHTER